VTRRGGATRRSRVIFLAVVGLCCGSGPSGDGFEGDAVAQGGELRDEEAGLTVEDAARERDEVRLDRIVDLRRAVRMVADGDCSRTKAQAGHEDGVLRALLHLEAKMSDGLRRHVYARLSQLQPEFGLRETTQPLRCVSSGAQARRR
jgi:hypothetical protein